MIIFEPKPIKCFSKLGWKTNEATVQQPGISRTCRVLREHTLWMFYEQNTFMVYDQIAMPVQLVRWLDAIGHTNRLRLKRLYLWSQRGETIERIEEYFANAGITAPIWTNYKDERNGSPIRQLAFEDLEVEHDEERLQRDLILLRPSKVDND